MADLKVTQVRSAIGAKPKQRGTLRALGFSRATILAAFEVEAIALSLIGFALGAVLSFLLSIALSRWLGGIAFGASTFTTNVVTLRLSLADLAGALGVTPSLVSHWEAGTRTPDHYIGDLARVLQWTPDQTRQVVAAIVGVRL